MNIAAAETVVAWNDHEGPRVSRAKGFDVISCTSCGFRHIVPLPEHDTLEVIYAQAYYEKDKPTFLAHAGEDQEWAILAQTDRLEAMEEILGPLRRRILDIGCGPGFFLKTAMDRGWAATGVEPSRQAAAHARGLGVTVTEDVFDGAAAGKLGRFDAVHLNNVLEHVPDPVAILKLAIGLLDGGGVLCINVPNDYTPLQVAARASLGLAEWWVAPPHHLNYFDFDSLAALLDRQGLMMAERMTSFPMEIFLLMGLDYTKDAALGRACHAKRKRFDLALERAGLKETRHAFYRALAQAGLGREAVLIAVKP